MRLLPARPQAAAAAAAAACSAVLFMVWHRRRLWRGICLARATCGVARAEATCGIAREGGYLRRCMAKGGVHVVLQGRGV